MIPLISVILCTNRIDHQLYLAIDSILLQSFSDFELIIVVNGPVVKDQNLLKNKFTDCRIRIITTEIEGLTFSLNLGIHLAKGDLIARMDGDDIAYPERLLRQHQYFKEDSNLSVCGTWIELIDDQNIASRVIKYPMSNEAIRKKMYLSNPLCHPTIMMKKKIINEVGAYMGYPQAEDYDLWNRLGRKSSIKFSNIPEVLLGYRKNSKGSARGSATAYSASSASQWFMFAMTGSAVWLVASTISLLKRIFLSKK